MPRPIHFEIQADQPERAIKFYQDLLGWEFTRYPGPMDYWVIKTGSEGTPGIDGGLLKRNGPPPAEGAAVNAYVCTVDIASVDQLAGRIAGAGGRVVVPKMAVPSVGWLAYAKDTEGNIFGFLQADPFAK
jgi:predicted enzyme related to lactoylglutathione lyase